MNSAIEKMGRALRSGLDTNVVIRYLTQDDATRSPIATQLSETSRGPDVRMPRT
jgi:predicted nucleic-acid-binding protein